jgi:hypothetical protein
MNKGMFFEQYFTWWSWKFHWVELQNISHSQYIFMQIHSNIKIKEEQKKLIQNGGQVYVFTVICMSNCQHVLAKFA